MKLYAILNEDRFVTAVLMRDSEPESGLWVGAFEGWDIGGHVAEDGTYTPPPAPPAPPYEFIVIPAANFMARLTDQEAEAIDEAMTARPLRIRSAWAAVVNRGDPIREDPALSPLWAPLRQTIVALYGEAKADEIMARPVTAFAAFAEETAAA